MDSGNANARALGSYQADALQNITGSFSVRRFGDEGGVVIDLGQGMVYRTDVTMAALSVGKTNLDIGYVNRINFDASRVARTSSESRGVNTALAPRIIAY